MEADPLVGRRVGEFTLLAKIGEGAFGQVYRAVQPLLQRDAAIKVRRASKPAEVSYFLREARLASGLDHPYAAHIYGFGAEPDELLWLAMELVDGTPLDKLLAARGGMPAERFLPLFERICEVVHSAHDRGIVHRDLKPANVMVVSRAGRLLPKLLDFGIARAPTRASDIPDDALDDHPVLGAMADTLRQDVTHRGIVVGSPAYMAPEQWLDASRADARTDQYALGVLAFQVLADKLPFDGTTIRKIATAHARQPVPELGNKALDAVLARAMAKSAPERFDDVMAFAAAFREALGVRAEAEALPRLDDVLRDTLAVQAPQPIAEAITTLEAARDLDQAWRAARLVASTIAQYVGLVALAGVLHLPRERRPDLPAMTELDAAGWFALTADIARAFATIPGAFPIPELVTSVVEPPATGGELKAFLAALTRMIGKLAWVNDYQLAVMRRGVLERWMGTRRTHRASLPAARDVADGTVVLVNADGAAVLSLSPLVQIARPSPGLPEEMFLFDGADRRGPRLVAQPAGFEHHDADLWKWADERGLSLGQATGATAAVERPPYRGLTTFTREDAGWFFGRERQVEGFVNRMRNTGLVALVGPSGAGKSSFVQAGVLGALPDGSRAVTVRPGTAPASELVAGLARAGITVGRDLADLAAALPRLESGVFVLVIDQFEELFTLGASADERKRYSDAIVAAAEADDRVRVLLTLRDDFLVRSEQLPALRERLAQSLELLATPAADDLHRILVEPAKRLGYRFEDDTLVDDMVASVAEQPGALPLLSFTASQLWELRDVRFQLLTRRAYQALGGVGGALANHAEATIAKLSDEENKRVREMFRHLVTSEGTRAIVTRREALDLVGGDAVAEKVIEALVGSRLVVASEGEAGHERIEVAHEALLSAWPRLVAWRQEDAEVARMRDQLRTTTRQWVERGRPRGMLWRDELLAEYRLWRTRYRGKVTDDEDAFGRACLDQATRAQKRRRLAITSAIGVLSVGVVALTLLGLSAKHSASEAKALLVDSYFEQGRTALLDGRHADALGYLRRAHDLGLDTPAARLMVDYALPSLEAQVAVFDAHSKAAALAWSPDGTRLYSAHGDGAVRVWDVAAKRLVATWKHDDVELTAMVLSADGARLVTGNHDGVARVLDAATGAVIAELPSLEQVIVCLEIVGDRVLVGAGVPNNGPFGRLRASKLPGGQTEWETAADHSVFQTCTLTGNLVGVAGYTGTAEVLDASTGAQRVAIAQGGRVRDIAFSPDGERVASASWNQTVVIASVRDGSVLHTLAHGRQAYLVSWSPDGNRLVSAGYDGVVKVWDSRTGETLFTLSGHRERIYAARFDRSGQRLVTASRDGTVRLWDLAFGRQIVLFEGHRSTVIDARFSPDDKRVASASWDGTVRVWSTDDPYVVQEWPSRGLCAEAGLEGDAVAMVCPDATPVWNLSARSRVELPAVGTIIAIASHGNTVLTGAKSVASRWDGGVLTWNRDVGSAITTVGAVADAVAIGTEAGDVLVSRARGLPEPVAHHGAKIASLAFTSTGVLASADAQGGVRVGDRAFELGAEVGALSFSEDGRLIAAGTQSGDLQVRDVATAALVSRGKHDGAMIEVAFDRTGQRVLGSSMDGMRLWRVRDGEMLAQLTTTPVLGVTFVGDTLAIGTGFDGTLRMWELDRGEPLLAIPSLTHAAVGIVRIDDDLFGLAGFQGGEVILYRLSHRDRWADVERLVAP